MFGDLNRHQQHDEHADVEFVVSAGDVERTFGVFDEALSFAFSVGLEEGEVTLDVLVYSPEGAEWFGGEEAVAQYEENPDAPVFQRFELKITDVGRVD
jgi:hypothetical protein